MISHGFTTATVMTTEMALKIPWVAIMTKSGIRLSRTPTSLENLEMIVPLVFESKNRIYALMTFSVMALCMFVVAFMMRSWKEIERAIPKNMKATILLTKRIIQELSAYYSLSVKDDHITRI